MTELNARVESISRYPILKPLRNGILRRSYQKAAQGVFAVQFASAEDLESFLQIAPIVLKRFVSPSCRPCSHSLFAVFILLCRLVSESEIDMVKRMVLAYHAISREEYTLEDINRAQELVDRFKEAFVEEFCREQPTTEGKVSSYRLCALFSGECLNR